MKIGILGNGMVGSATGKVLAERGFGVLAYDLDPARSTHSRKEVLAADWVLLCVQTPHDHAKATAILVDAAKDVDESKLVVRSTILPSMYEALGWPIVWPEFLTARTAVEDMRTPTRIIVGGVRGWKFVEEVIQPCWPDAPRFMFREGADACMVKFACNVFGALKVLYWNLIHQWAGSDEGYRRVLDACLASGWIAPQHTSVPGPDGKMGFGGVCFPKDMALLAAEFALDGRGDDSAFLTEALRINGMIRGDAGPLTKPKD